jgi:hypothetical protein
MRITTPLPKEGPKNAVAGEGKATTNPLQPKQPANNPLQLQAEETAAPQVKSNNTGLPNNLKAGVEALSGYSMDDVKVHYNSDKPTQLQALAYAQGNDIHIAPGQEQHLPHEAWHVVQQKQGRVQPTLQMKQGISVNDDKGLEHEADVMGSKALSANGTVAGNAAQVEWNKTQVVQRMHNGSDDEDEDTGEKKEGNEKGTDKKEEKKEKETGKKEEKKSTPTAKNKKKKKQPANKGNTTGGQQKIPATKEELEAAAKRLPAFKSMGLEQVLQIFFKVKIKPGSYKGTQEEWQICQRLADELLQDLELKTPTVESKESISEAAIKEFKKNNEINHNKEIAEVEMIDVISNHVRLHSAPGDTAFVANLITIPVDLQKLVDRYATLYNPNNTGFAMVIGLNRFRSCDKEHERLLRNIKMPNAPFPLTILIFSWDLPWKNSFATACKDYNSNIGISGFTTAVEKYEKSFLRGKKNVVPYGTLRSEVLAHEATSTYVKALSQTFKNVYIFNTDADAPSFQTQEQKNNQQAPPLLEAYAREIKQSRHLPNLMVGGYRFDEETTGGDLKPNVHSHRLTLLANQLDSEFRIMVSKINSELIYPTEPNMIFLAAHGGNMSPLENLKRIPANKFDKEDKSFAKPWGSGPREGIRLRQNIRQAGDTGNNITTYLPNLSTPTDSSRFRVPPFKPDSEVISLEKFFENRIEAMFSEEQTYITKLAVMIEGSGAQGNYSISPAWVEKFIKSKLFDAIKNPASIDTSKQLPPPTQQDSKSGIAGLFEQGLITYFIIQNIGIITNIHKELSRQYFIIKSIYSSGISSVIKDAASSSAAKQQVEGERQKEVKPPPIDTGKWKKKMYEIITSILNSDLVKHPLGANNCLIEAILNKLRIDGEKRKTIIKNVREALQQNSIRIGEMLHATEGVLQLIAAEIKKETGITIGRVTIDYNHISNEIQQNIEYMDNVQLNNLLDNVTDIITIGTGQDIAITHTGFAHFE